MDILQGNSGLNSVLVAVTEIPKSFLKGHSELIGYQEFGITSPKKHPFQFNHVLFETFDLRISRGRCRHYGIASYDSAKVEYIAVQTASNPR